jgi:NAD(P)-dependent dehydrogenase (short-subunit alcohol dehydrogenase family)
MPTVLVTGAGRGLGLEFTRQYAADGWEVLACVRTPARAPELTALAAGAAGRIEVHALDLSDHSAIDGLAHQMAGRRVDLLLNNAGTMGKGDFAKQGITMDRFGQADFADWQQTFRVNVFAPMKMAEAFIEHVARSDQKKIVSISSIVGSQAKNTAGGLYSYRASKAALNAIMRSMSIDLARRHSVIAAPLHPGWVRTDMGGGRADLSPEESVAGCRRVIAGLTPDKAGRYWMYDGSELPW